MRLRSVVLLALLLGATAHAAGDPEPPKQGELWVDTVLPEEAQQADSN